MGASPLSFFGVALVPLLLNKDTRATGHGSHKIKNATHVSWVALVN